MSTETEAAVLHEIEVATKGVEDLAKLVVDRDMVGFGKRAAFLIVDLVPAETLRAYLEEASVKRANALAQAAEDLKFGTRG